MSPVRFGVNLMPPTWLPQKALTGQALMRTGNACCGGWPAWASTT